VYGKLKNLISMDLEKHEDGIYSQKELVEKGKKLIEEGDRSFLDAEINAEEMDMMLFTSGTTSMSKAVALSHKNICTNIVDIASVLNVNKDDIPNVSKNEEPKPNKFSKINFLSYKKICVSLSILIILVGAIFMCVGGLNLGIDYKAGTQITIVTDENLSKNTIKKNNISLFPPHPQPFPPKSPQPFLLHIPHDLLREYSQSPERALHSQK